VKFIKFSFNDVVRHPVVAKIVKAYEEEENR
ncbi:MAG: PhoH family protein, partial [Lactobacillus iners]|nr:PhoH family protein [Lactobacillus iners]